MTAAKLRIDLSQGLIEVEGSETFILELYSDFKERLSSITTPVGKPSLNRPLAESQSNTASEPSLPSPKLQPQPPASRTKTRRAGKEEAKFLADLDLTQGSLGRLKDFHAKYAPRTNYEHNLIFTYYLKEGHGLDEITGDHILTCYRTASLKVPVALRQSIIDTKAKGWLAVDGAEIRLTTAGRNHLEYDLVKATS